MDERAHRRGLVRLHLTVLPARPAHGRVDAGPVRCRDHVASLRPSSGVPAGGPFARGGVCAVRRPGRDAERDEGAIRAAGTRRTTRPQDVIPNTRLAQQLAELARTRGSRPADAGRLMDAYWAEARDIGDTRRAARARGRGGHRRPRGRLGRPGLSRARARIDRAGALDRRHRRSGLPPRPAPPRARRATARAVRAGVRAAPLGAPDLSSFRRG